MSTFVRVGKLRNHTEGIAINILRDYSEDSSDSVLLATSYGADEDEARMRAEVIARALGDHYRAEVKL